MPEKIKAVIQYPGTVSKIIEIGNCIEAINHIVGGLSTEVTIPENDLKLIFNMHANGKGKPLMETLWLPNLQTLWGSIYGTVVIASKENGKYISLTTEQVQSARAWLLKHTYEVKEHE